MIEKLTFAPLMEKSGTRIWNKSRRIVEAEKKWYSVCLYFSCSQFHQTLLTYMRNKVWEFHFYVANDWPEVPVCLHFPGMTLSVSSLIDDSGSLRFIARDIFQGLRGWIVHLMVGFWEKVSVVVVGYPWPWTVDRAFRCQLPWWIIWKSQAGFSVHQGEDG